MVKPTVSTVLWMVFAWMLSMPVTAQEVKKSPVPLVEMSLSPSRIDWHSVDPAVKVQRWTLILAGPDDFFLRREFKAGKAPFLSLFDSEGDRLPDGSYTWELKSVSQGSADPRRESGSFSIQGGNFVEARQGNGGSAPKPPLVPTIAEDTFIGGNLVVQGNTCMGDSCSTTDPNFSALKLKSVRPNILFDGIQIPEGGGGSSHDWGLFVNDANTAQFSIVDLNDEFPSSTPLIPFSIAAGAPTGSLFIAGDGKVGLGTSTPALRFDVRGNAAGQAVGRIQNSSATGFSSIEYFDEGGTIGLSVGIDNANNNTRINSVNNNPIVVLTNSAERMRVTSAGNVGIGTASPVVKLDIQGNAANSEVVRIANSSASGFPGINYLDSSGAIKLYFGLDNAANTTRMNSTDNHPIVVLTNDAEHVRIDSDGDVGINCNNPTFDLVIASGSGCSTPSSSINAGSTSFTASSSRTIKENLASVKVPDILEKIGDVGVYQYDFIGGPKERIGLMAEDFHQIFQRGSDKVLDGQEVEMALWLAVQELTAQNKKLAEQNKEISERLAELEARLATEPVNTP